MPAKAGIHANRPELRGKALVMPAKAGIHANRPELRGNAWIPAFPRE
jgi:hypothetical protein